MIHEAFHVARSGRPGPVVIDLPKDILMGQAPYRRRAEVRHRTYNPKVEPQADEIEQAVELMAQAKRPVFYVGGGVINAGPKASAALAQLVRETGFPITLTLMGLGAYPGSDPQFLGMLGMHGTFEANLAMHGCDLMIAIGSRFDDRVTGRLDSFSPGSTKIHIDIDPSSINKNVPVDVPIVGGRRPGDRRPARPLAGEEDQAQDGPDQAVVGPDRRLAREGQRCAIARTTRSSSRNMRSSGCTR